MAITVAGAPRVQQRTAGQLVQPQVRKTASDFGGEVFGAAANLLGQEADRRMKEAQFALVQDSDNQMSAWENDALYGENGYMNTKGKVAVEQSDNVLKSYDEEVTRVASGMPDGPARSAFLNQSKNRRFQIERTTGRHMVAQADQYKQTQNQAYIANSQVAAANNFNDPERINDEISRQVSAIRTQGVLQGKPEEQITLEANVAQSTTHQAVVNRMLSINDYQGAKSYLEQNKAGIMPDTFDQLMKGANQGEQVKKGQATKRLQSEISDYMAYKNSGGADETDYSRDGLVAVFGEDEGGRVYEEIQDVNRFAKTYNEIAFASPDEINAMIEAERPDTAEDFRREAGQFSNIVKAMETRTKGLANDPAQYALGAPSIAREYDEYQRTGNGTGYAAATLAEQERLGVGPGMQKVLSGQQADFVVNEYRKGGENAANFIQGIRDSFGDYFPQVMRDLNAAGLSPTAQVVSVMGPGNASNLLAEADKEGMKALKEIVGDDNYKTIDGAVPGELEDLRETLALAPNGAVTYQKIHESVRLLAVKYASMGVPIGDATATAAKEVVNNRYEFVDGYRVPREIRTESGTQAVDAVLVREGAGLAIKNLKNVDLALPYHEGMPDDVAREVYLRNLQAAPVTLNDETGIVLVNQLGNAILDSENNPITLTWQELQDSAKTQAPSTIEAYSKAIFPFLR